MLHKQTFFKDPVLTATLAVFNMRSVFTDNHSPIVQLVERRTVNPYVAGSSPAWGAITFIMKVINNLSTEIMCLILGEFVIPQ